MMYSQAFDLESTFNPTLTQEDRKTIKDNIYHYSQEIKKNPDNPYSYLNRGVQYANLGLYPDAITDYNTCLKIDSTIPEAYYNRGIAKARFRYTKAACIDVRKSAKLGLKIGKKTYNEKCGLFMRQLGKLD